LLLVGVEGGIKTGVVVVLVGLEHPQERLAAGVLLKHN
jgi:hypothetical protein